MNDLVGLVALLALLAYLLPAAVRMPRRLADGLRWAALGLVVAGVLVGLVLFLAERLA